MRSSLLGSNAPFQPRARAALCLAGASHYMLRAGVISLHLPHYSPTHMRSGPSLVCAQCTGDSTIPAHLRGPVALGQSGPPSAMAIVEPMGALPFT